MAKGNKLKKIIKDYKTVSINNLSHFYGKNENKKQVLNDVNLNIERGELVLLKGHPSITDLMERFDKLQSFTKKKIKESKYKLVELPYIDCKEDPVRPELDLAFRQAYGRKIFGLKDDEGDIAAIMCFAFTDEVPKTVEEMEVLSKDSAMKALHRAGVQGSVAIAYTV